MYVSENTHVTYVSVWSQTSNSAPAGFYIYTHISHPWGGGVYCFLNRAAARLTLTRKQLLARIIR